MSCRVRREEQQGLFVGALGQACTGLAMRPYALKVALQLRILVAKAPKQLGHLGHVLYPKRCAGAVRCCKTA